MSKPAAKQLGMFMQVLDDTTATELCGLGKICKPKWSSDEAGTWVVHSHCCKHIEEKQVGIDLSIQTGLDLQSSPQQATTIFVLNKCHLALSSLNAIFIKYCFSPKSSIARTIFQHITSVM
jgi:hypothetical protein